MGKAALTIGGTTFEVGDRVSTPEGVGIMVGLDPFGDEEIGVRLDGSDAILWFSFLVCQVDAFPDPAPDPAGQIELAE